MHGVGLRPSVSSSSATPTGDVPAPSRARTRWSGRGSHGIQPMTTSWPSPRDRMSTTSFPATRISPPSPAPYPTTSIHVQAIPEPGV